MSREIGTGKAGFDKLEEGAGEGVRRRVVVGGDAWCTHACAIVDDERK